MPEGQLEMSIEIENMKEVQGRFTSFQKVELKRTLHRSNQRTANKVEKELKAVPGFTDRTGKLRRSFYADATYNPLGIVFGSLDPKAVFVAYAHGTWKGSWWETFKKRIIPEIITSMRNAVERAVKKFNQGE